MVSEPVDRLLVAVTDLLVAEGYEGVSVRKVAAAAGVSLGAVQHHFPTKDAMLTAAMERATRQFQARLTGRVDPGSDAATALRAVADELLAVDPAARAASGLWVVQLARSAVDPATAARHGAEWQQVEDLLAELLAGARPDLDPAAVRRGAGSLLALVDGPGHP